MIKVATGNRHMLVASEHYLAACGENNCGSLGLGDYANRNTLVPVTNLSPLFSGEEIFDIAAGDFFSFILTATGQLWSCGYNNYGQLGLGDFQNYNLFTQINLTELLQPDEKIIQVTTGCNHTVILTNTRRLLSCGSNSCGQLGLGNLTNQNTFMPILNFPPMLEGEKISYVAAGDFFTVALTTMGRIFGCGQNDSGQLSLENYLSCSNFSLAKLPALEPHEKIIHITAGSRHCVALTNTGRLLSCGNNFYGQLGLIDLIGCFVFSLIHLPTDEKIIQVIAHGSHTIFSTDSNKIWGCGKNESGQLGFGDTNKRNTFEPAINLAPLLEDEKIFHLSASDTHTIFITSYGRIYSCGSNEFYQLGLKANHIYYTFNMVGQLNHPTWVKPTTPIGQQLFPLEQPLSPFKNLPDEILFQIFNLLSMKDLEVLIHTCKKFRAIITDAYKISCFSIKPERAINLRNFSQILFNAREIYSHLSAAQQTQFKDEFLKCFPEQLQKNHLLWRILPSIIPEVDHQPLPTDLLL